MAITFHANGQIDGINNTNFLGSMPAGTVIKYQHTTSATRTNITSGTTWTTFTGTQVDFTPTFSNS